MRKRDGFTLIELLVVIAIIGILSSVVLVSLDTARERARTTAAQEELRNIRTGIMMLVSDTGKAPNGCTYGRTANPEVWLNTKQAGLLEEPEVNRIDHKCEWTTSDVAKWKGPYIQTGLDPWGRAYRFDPDYVPYRNCDDVDGELHSRQAIVAPGPDGNPSYTCDDIWIDLE